MKVKRFAGWLLSAALLAGAVGGVLPAKAAAGPVVLSRQEVYDKILGGWAGQMAGVAWAAPTEFQAKGRMLTEDEIPEWTPSMVNGGFWQDDLYAEIPLMQALADHGVDCDVKTVGEYFRDTSFALFHANLAARLNLRAGIHAPLSGHYLYNDHSDDIDWQIEADFVGQMLPGLTNAAISRAWELGHIMNYGDGVYGGVYVSAMHARAFTADTLDEILEAGRQSVPEGSLFREAIEDVYRCYDQGMTWQQTWQVIEDNWGEADHCIEGAGISFNIDAKLNAAYVLIGLLYGQGDFEQSMKISMMCGQDSDCNPSTAASILGNWMGYEAIPDKWKSGLELTGTKFSYTEYDFQDIVDMNLALAEEAFVKYGGSINGDSWTIPAGEEIVPPPLEQLPEICPLSIQTAPSGSTVTFNLRVYDESMIRSVAWDFGDGSNAEGLRVSHQYQSSGLYTVTCTITSVDGETYTRTREWVSGRNIASQGTAGASHMPQGGGGNPDIGVIADGIKPDAGSGGDQDQFDTYHWDATAEEQWIGYTFEEEHTFGMVVFQEGKHFNNGGWFANGLRIQVQRGGQWVDVECSGSTYPVSNSFSDFGDPFETFYFQLNNETGTGIRLCGVPGGSEYFISCAELEVYEAGADSSPGTVPSPDLPAVEGAQVQPLFSLNPYDWSGEGNMIIAPDDNGCLTLQNVDGLWPKADHELDIPLTAAVDSAQIWYDFRVEQGVDTSLIVYFGNGDTPMNSDDALTLNSYIPGVSYNAGSGDIVGDGKRHSGYLRLSDLDLKEEWIQDSKVTITGMRVYAAGTALTPVILGQFALVSSAQTPSDPSTDPSADPSAGPSTSPSSDPSANPTTAGPSTPSASGQKPGTNPSTGAGLPLAAGTLMAVSASVLVWCRRKHGK
ncbi:MAG: PKD domain-containing protein [Clostridiales bacterium]|nr:PKD domain-containing protein [Clostridiales bacterium]